MKTTKLLNDLMIIVCLVVTLSCSSGRTQETTRPNTDKNTDLTQQEFVFPTRAPPATTLKPKTDQVPNTEGTPLLAKPTLSISSIEADDPLYKRGYKHYRKQEYDLAINDLTEAIRLNPSLSVAYWVRGLSYSNKDQYEQAINDYGMAIKLDPKEPRLYRNRGMVYHKLNLEHKALSDFSEAIKIESTFSSAYRSRAHSYVAVGRYRDALVDLDSAIRLAPSNADSYKDRADVYEKLGLDKRAHSDNSKACSLDDHWC